MQNAVQHCGHKTADRWVLKDTPTRKVQGIFNWIFKQSCETRSLSMWDSWKNMQHTTFVKISGNTVEQATQPSNKFHILQADSLVSQVSFAVDGRTNHSTDLFRSILYLNTEQVFVLVNARDTVSPEVQSKKQEQWGNAVFIYCDHLPNQFSIIGCHEDFESFSKRQKFLPTNSSSTISDVLSWMTIQIHIHFPHPLRYLFHVEHRNTSENLRPTIC